MPRTGLCLVALVLTLAGCGHDARPRADATSAAEASTNAEASTATALPELSWGYPALQWLDLPELRIALPGPATRTSDRTSPDTHTVEDAWTTPGAALVIVRDPTGAPWDLPRRLRQAVESRDGTLVSSQSGPVAAYAGITGRMTRVLKDTINTIDLQLIACDRILVEVMTASPGSMPAGADRYLDTVLRTLVSTMTLKDCSADS